ncbi:hypothetical protein [Neptuniibacter halophilus]|uniref:hypothetical protein n=1 Tax=Neptuniibacter halophilus TaxID=651666 RepID=UPI002573B108|nr:hypothetical protein [Neptuniibacter halophilus]
MKWMIIILVMMSLIGSMMWVMPTKRQKYQAGLRLKAKQLGLQVQLEKVTPPRAKGELEPEVRDRTAYRLMRQGLSREQKNRFKSWHIFRVESLADTGLPPGWSWQQGERDLSDDQLAQVADLVAQLPDGVFSIESTPVYLGVHWDEEGGDSTLQALHAELNRFSEKGF